MELSHDELAGVVDLFGALTRDELSQACTELAFKRGVGSAFDGVDDALAAYRLVAVHPDDESVLDGEVGETMLAVGPTAFPVLPEGAEDLPHIMDVGERTLDRVALGEVVERRFRMEAARAVAEDDEARIDRLLDVSYDLETWAPVELGGMRERLDAADE